jgi:hypothetical protein
MIPRAAAHEAQRVIVYVGYLDNEHGTPSQADIPTPFDPDSDTFLVSTGGSTATHDTGVIRFLNRTRAPITIDPGMTVTIGATTFKIWDQFLPITLDPNKNLVLAETGQPTGFNFDSSDVGRSADPIVSGSINGQRFSYTDVGRVLLGREDGAGRGENETTPYQMLAQQSLTIDSDGSHAVIATTSADGRPVAVDYAVDRQTGAFHSTIILANTPVMEMSGTLPDLSVTHQSVTNATANVTKALVGANSVTFFSQGDLVFGQILGGQVNGRIVQPVPLAIGLSPTLAFVDGKPAPNLGVSPRDADAILEFIGLLQNRGLVPMQASYRSCSDSCVAEACDDLKSSGARVAITTSPTGDTVCSGIPDSRLFEYKDAFDRCWNSKCNLLKWVLVDAPTGWLDLGRNFMNWVSGR